MKTIDSTYPLLIVRLGYNPKDIVDEEKLISYFISENPNSRVIDLDNLSDQELVPLKKFDVQFHIEGVKYMVFYWIRPELLIGMVDAWQQYLDTVMCASPRKNTFKLKILANQRFNKS